MNEIERMKKQNSRKILKYKRMPTIGGLRITRKHMTEKSCMPSSLSVNNGNAQNFADVINSDAARKKDKEEKERTEEGRSLKYVAAVEMTAWNLDERCLERERQS